METKTIKHGDCCEKNTLSSSHSGKVIDPVCGMSVERSNSCFVRYQSHLYYFCSERCMHLFQTDPGKYISPRKEDASSEIKAEAVYTCPMHPEIRKKGPGSCPICGMALESVEPSIGGSENLELADMARRLKLGALFTLPILLLAMGHGTDVAIQSAGITLI